MHNVSWGEGIETDQKQPKIALKYTPGSQKMTNYTSENAQNDLPGLKGPPWGAQGAPGTLNYPNRRSFGLILGAFGVPFGT